METKAVEVALRMDLEPLGWRLQRLCHLPPAYVKELEVTPVFIPNIIRRAKGDHVIDGYVGIVHKVFEVSWIEKNGLQEKTGRNTFCFIRNIANIPELMRLSYIEGASAQQDIGRFSSALTTILEGLPHNSAALADVFRSELVLGTPLEKYVAFGRQRKFDELKEFVLQQENRSGPPQ